MHSFPLTFKVITFFGLQQLVDQAQEIYRKKLKQISMYINSFEMLLKIITCLYNAGINI